MPDTLLSAREAYDIAPLGSPIRFSDGTPEPPARHRRKRTAWLSDNGAGRVVRKTPADHLSGPSFALHLGSFGSGDMTVVEAYRIITMASTLSLPRNPGTPPSWPNRRAPGRRRNPLPHPPHLTKLPALTDALRALGKRLVVAVEKAA